MLVGANVCAKQGDAVCSDSASGFSVDPGFGLQLGVVFKKDNWFGMQTDFTYGSMSPDAAGVSTTVHFLGLHFGPRFSLFLADLELFAMMGMGWGMAKSEGGSDHHLNLIFQGGAQYFLLGRLGLGLWFRWHMPVLGEDDATFNDYTSEVMIGAGATLAL